MPVVDLNADMGEEAGDDAALLRIVTSANVACGAHAGSPEVMAEVMRQAVAAGVGLGAHPGFADRAHFGRRRIDLGPAALAGLVRDQVAAAAGAAAAAGGRLRHLKLHGALANMAAEDAGLARICYRAALEVQDDLVVMVLAATAQARAAEALGAGIAREIFADRAYEDDATLVDRGRPGAVIHDPARAAARVVAMVREGAIIAESGKRIPSRIDTVCLHGDTPEAVDIARAVRSALEGAGVRVARL